MHKWSGIIVMLMLALSAVVYRTIKNGPGKTKIDMETRKIFSYSSQNQNNGNQKHVPVTKRGDFTLRGLRYWETVAKEQKNLPGLSFTIMSYNVLAQDLVHKNPHLYTQHNQKSLNWNFRWENLIQEIKSVNPDILSLQEVQGSHRDKYFAILETLGYKGIYKQRTGIRTDGCAIYFKHNLIDLVEYQSVEYKQPNIGILNRDNVGIIAKFMPKNQPTQEFVVANTHLLFNPKRQDVRLAQIQVLLSEIERLSYIGEQGKQYAPIILSGDFNSLTNSAVYQFLTKGRLKYEALSKPRLEYVESGPLFGKELLPLSLSITDQCQHAGLLRLRKQGRKISRTEEADLIQLSNNDYPKKKVFTDVPGDAHLFTTGTLTHNFNMESVYKHFNNHDSEASTFQDKWVTVDYIFYSKSKENKLILLDRFRLPTEKQLGNLHIPNYTIGSDHLSLFAKFKLYY